MVFKIFSKKDLKYHCETTDCIIYKVPIKGYYEIFSKTMTHVPTGQKVQIENPNYSWFKFWLPKNILVPELKMDYLWEGKEIKFLEAGDIVIGPKK